MLMLCLAKLSISSAAIAADADFCVSRAQEMPLIKIRYNFGSLTLDNTKNTKQITYVCKDKAAAGCFARNQGRYATSAKRNKVNIGNKTCIILSVLVEFDFSGATIYVTSEYSGCKARAVLRHEEQHFMIWKKANEELIKELKVALKKAALQDVRDCNSKDGCSAQIDYVVYNLTKSLYDKWAKYSETNNARLDEVDHDGKNEFAFRVCDPYTLEIF